MPLPAPKAEVLISFALATKRAEPPETGPV
jgi:hypothetical protein